MDAFSKLTGKRSPIIGETLQPPPKPAFDPTEAMAMKLLKNLIPGFDPSIIQKVGEEVGTALEHFKSSCARIEAQNADIIARLERIEANAHAPASNDGRLSPFGGQ